MAQERRPFCAVNIPADLSNIHGIDRMVATTHSRQYRETKMTDVASIILSIPPSGTREPDLPSTDIELICWEETPEQIADEIFDGLYTALRMADAGGMPDVSELILEAIGCVGKWTPTETPTVGCQSAADVRLVRQKILSERELDALFDALNGLCDQYRIPFVLRVILEDSYEFVARSCGTPIHTAVFNVMIAFEYLKSVTKKDPALKKSA